MCCVARRAGHILHVRVRHMGGCRNDDACTVSAGVESRTLNARASAPHWSYHFAYIVAPVTHEGAAAMEGMLWAGNAADGGAIALSRRGMQARVRATAWFIAGQE